MSSSPTGEPGGSSSPRILERVAKGSIVAFATETLLRLKGLIILPILTKTFGTVDYGIWAQVTVLVTLLSPVVTCGLDSASTRFLSGRSRSEVREGFYSSLLTVTALGMVAGVSMAAASRPLATAFFGGTGNAAFVGLAGAYMAVSVVRNFLQKYFRIVLAMGVYFTATVFVTLSNAVAAAVVAVMGASLMTLIVVMVALEALTAAALGLAVVRRLGLAMPRFVMLGELLAFGLPLVPTGWLVWMLNVSDRFFLSHYRGLADVGVYAVAYNLGLMLMQVFFNPVWLTYPPAAVELHVTGRPEELRTLTRYSLKYGLLLMLPATAAFSILARPILVTFSTAAFARGAFVIPLVAVGYLFSMLAAFPVTGLELAKRTRTVLWINVAAAAANVTVNVVFVPVFGMAACAVATLLAFALQFSLAVALGSRYVRLEMTREDAWRIAAVTSSVAIVASAFRPGSDLGLLSAVAAVAATFVSVSVVTGAVGPEERAFLRRMLGRGKRSEAAGRAAPAGRGPSEDAVAPEGSG